VAGTPGTGYRARPYGWLAAAVAAVPLVYWGTSVNLAHAHAVVRAAVAVTVLAGSGVLVLTPGVALISVVARHRRIGRATALGLLFGGSSAVAMAAFWLWFASPVAGRAADAVFGIAALALIGVYGRSEDLRRLDLATPLWLALGVALVYTGLAYVQGGITATPVHAIETRFWLEGDNEIPLTFAQRIALRGPLDHYLHGGWLLSDRPPLQSGFVLLQWPLWGNGQVQLPYQLLSTCLQVSWLPALWTVLRVRGLGARRTAVAVLATAATGTVFFNSVYVWPKMLAGSLALAALAILLSGDEGDRLPGIGVLTAALATLAMLAHGAAAFALIALLPFGWRLRHRVTVRSAALFATAAVVLYVPWMAFQHLVAPPANRLLKWELAGVTQMTSTGFLKTLEQQYGHLSAGQLFYNKVTSNLHMLIGDKSFLTAQTPNAAWAHQGFLGYARLSQLFQFLPASVPLVLGAFALLLPSGRRALATFRPLAVFLGVTLVAWVVLQYGGPRSPAIVHQSSYAMLVLYFGLCAVAVTMLPRALAGLILAASLAWFAVCWLPGLGFHPGSGGQGAHPRVDAGMVAVCLAGLAVLGVTCALMWRSQRAAQGAARGALPGEPPGEPAF